ncbi:MAG: hypothetical protein ACHQM6_10490 [Candidatus Kapaibacterium sp.]
MNSQTLISDFFSGPAAVNLKEKQLLESIIAPLAADSPVLYDLTFHAAFAKRIFDIIKREGPHTQGFDRMQQSFFESVEKVKEILKMSAKENPVVLAELTSPTPEARAKLSRIIEDLALLKNWLISRENK